MSEELEVKKWECDACAEAEGGSGLPCILTSPLLPDVSVCPMSGDECEWQEVTEDNRRTPDLQAKLKVAEAFEEALKGWHNGYDPNNDIPEPLSPQQAVDDLQTDWDKLEDIYAEQVVDLQAKLKEAEKERGNWIGKFRDVETENTRLREGLKGIADSGMRYCQDCSSYDCDCFTRFAASEALAQTKDKKPKCKTCGGSRRKAGTGVIALIGRDTPCPDCRPESEKQ